MPFWTILLFCALMTFARVHAHRKAEMSKTALKHSVTCFESYFYEVNVANGKSLKHMVRSPKNPKGFANLPLKMLGLANFPSGPQTVDIDEPRNHRRSGIIPKKTKL
jgi:hypothetical protein